MSPKGKPTDGTLVTSCLRGDEAAWRELIARYQRLIYSIAVGYRLPAGEADEIFQRVAVKLFENLGRLRSAEGLPAWLVVTTRRECQAALRGARRWDPLEEGSPAELSADPPDVAQELHLVSCEHTLALAFQELDETCRGLLTGLWLEDPAPSYDELARRLGRPVGSLGPTRMRCLKKLRKLYVGLGGEKP